MTRHTRIAPIVSALATGIACFLFCLGQYFLLALFQCVFLSSTRYPWRQLHMLELGVSLALCYLGMKASLAIGKRWGTR